MTAGARNIDISETHHILWVTLLVVLICGQSIAQPYNSTSSFFQVDQKKGCAPFTVTIVSVPAAECTAIKPCTMTFGDNTGAQQNQFTHTYTVPGTYTLNVQPQSGLADNIVITVDQNIQPNFEIYACASNRAQIRVTDNAYDQYVIDFTNDGTPEYILPFSNNIQTPSFTYVPAGTYTASVRGRDLNSADNCTAKTQSFTTLLALPAPTITTLTSVDAANIKLDFTTVPNVQYRLEIALNNATTFQVFKTLFGVATLDITDLKLDENFYCFRLGAFNPCTNSSNYSNTICTNRLVLTAQSDVVIVTSNTAGPGILSYSIARTPGAVVTSGANPFNDVDVVCKTNYCYRITTNYSVGKKSISLEKCVTSFSTTIPTAIDNVTGTVGNDGATLTWIQDPLFVPVAYGVQRSSAGGTLGNFATAAASPYLDNIYTTGGKYCYAIDYTDKCGNASPPGVLVCPVQLTGTLSNSNSISLAWSAYEGWSAGVKNYVLEKYGLNGALITSTTLTDLVFLDDVPDAVNQYVRYVVRAIPNDPATTAALSNELTFIKNANLYYPTAFTPNNDALNDGFIVSGQFIVKLKMTIFDRWGSAIFSTEKNEPWDGTSNGKPMPPATYVWKVDINDRAGRTFSEEGIIAIIR